MYIYNKFKYKRKLNGIYINIVYGKKLCHTCNKITQQTVMFIFCRVNELHFLRKNIIITFFSYN